MTADLTPAASASGASAGAAATRIKSAASTTSQYGHGYPHGHLGFLSADEQDALAAFREVLEERGLYRRGPPASHDDQTLL